MRSYSYFYSSFATKVFATICSLVAGLVSLRLFRNYLTVAEFGILLPAIQVLNYIPFLDGGVRTASNCKLLALESKSESVRLLRFCQKFYSWFWILTLVAVTFLMFAYWLTPNVRASGQSLAVFASLGISMALLLTSSAQGGLLVGLQAQNVLYLITGIGTLINLLGLALGLHFGLRFWAFVLANGLTFLVTWPAYIWAIKSKIPEIRVFDFHLTSSFWSEFRLLRRGAFDSFRCQVSIMLLFSVDILIVGTCRGPEEAAVYGPFIRIFGIIKAFIQSLGDVSWPLSLKIKPQPKSGVWFLLQVNVHGFTEGSRVELQFP